MDIHAHEDSRVAAAIERQMQTWTRLREIEERVIRSREGAKDACGVCFATISREAGADGGEVARRVGECLGWDVYDKNLLDCVAERFCEPRSMLDLVDETPTNWVFDVLGTWMDRKIIPHEKYVMHVSRVVQSIARRGSAVFVGRGAQFILPHNRTLAVRIVAPLAYRIDRIMRLRSLAVGDAKRLIAEIDRGRAEFISRFFRRDIDDPLLYDLVINAERCGVAATVEQIVLACCRRVAATPAAPVTAVRA